MEKDKKKNKNEATEQTSVAEKPTDNILDRTLLSDSEHSFEKKSQHNDEIMRLLTADSRVAHLMVDILAGRDPDEAVANHFPSKLPDNIEEMTRNAEQQGYLRGRNEAVNLQMKQRPLWQSDEINDSDSSPVPSFLRRIHRSIWDK